MNFGHNETCDDLKADGGESIGRRDSTEIPYRRIVSRRKRRRESADKKKERGGRLEQLVN